MPAHDLSKYLVTKGCKKQKSSFSGQRALPLKRKGDTNHLSFSQSFFPDVGQLKAKGYSTVFASEHTDD